MKINVSLDDELVKRLDAYAERTFTSRSGLICLACTHYLNENELVNSIRELSLRFRKIAETGSIDDETLEYLKKFEMMSELLRQ